ncbi:MAG: sugar-transfer associated ATP-grasp domain-containing protein [Marinilabiliaceae bacterium]
MIHFSKGVSLAYRVTRTIAAKLYYLRRDLETDENFRKRLQELPRVEKADDGAFRAYKKRWSGWTASTLIPRSEFDFYYTLNHVQTPDFIPISVYFSTINGSLNFLQMAWGYAQKGNYARMFDIDNEPVSLLRNLNGLFFDGAGNVVSDAREYYNRKLKDYTKVLVKPSIDSSGGRNVFVFEKDQKDQWKCLNGDITLELDHLQKYYGRNYVVQEYLEQHPFFKQFNESSFNTIRIIVYRSPSDENPRVLHSVLKAGSPGNVVDNLKVGSTAFYINPDGTFLYGRNASLQRVDTLPSDPSIQLKDLGKVPAFDEMTGLAVKIAEKVPYNRLTAFDMNIDKNEKPRLVELNNYNAGVTSQIFGVPFFREYTQEVIDYCKSHKKTDFLRI